jgi:hypothetical protein
MFLKSLLAQHVSDVTASIVRSTTVVYSHRFWVSGVFIQCGLYRCWATSSLYHGQFQSETDRDRVIESVWCLVELQQHAMGMNGICNSNQ